MSSFTTPAWIVQLAPIISIIADLLVAVGALIGIAGIRQWRKQLKFGDQYQTAHRVIGLCLRFKREFALVRRITPACEIIQTTTQGTDLIRHSECLQQDFNERQVHLVELFGVVQRLYDESLEVEAYLGIKEARLAEPLEAYYTMLNKAFAGYQQLIHALQAGPPIQDAFEKVQENYVVLFAIDGDGFAISIDDAIETIRNRLKKYIK